MKEAAILDYFIEFCRTYSKFHFSPIMDRDFHHSICNALFKDVREGVTDVIVA
jgi:hypothetical protein